MPDSLVPTRSISTSEVRAALVSIALDLAAYTSADLLAVQQCAEATVVFIRDELRTRDSRAVDEACRLEVA